MGGYPPVDGPYAEMLQVTRAAHEMAVAQQESPVAEPADGEPYPEPVARPDLSEGSHLSYAVQWFIFAAAVGVGWVFAVRHSAGKRRSVTTTAS